MVLNNEAICGKIETLDEVLDVVVKVKDEPFTSAKRMRARERAISKGFTDEYHMEGFFYFNRLDSEQYSGYDVDVLHMLSGGDGFE